MGSYAINILATAVLFVAMIVQLAAKPRFSTHITGTCIAIALIGGLFFYGYGFAATTDDPLLALVRALLAVCGIFVAKIDFGSISAAPLFQEPLAVLLFYVIHLLALYATASTAITLVGAEMLRRIRLWLARRGDLNLIFGVNDESLALGKQLLGKKKGVSVVYVDSTPGTRSGAIAKLGCVLRTDASAVAADDRFLRTIGIAPGQRTITLYALSRDNAENLRFAQDFLVSLKARGIRPEQTRLIIPGVEESSLSFMQALKNTRYGYGFITVVHESTLAARLLSLQAPPWQHIPFDETGRATADFEALVIGFGQVGQAVLRSLVMNGQFAGSTFRCAVFSPDCHTVNGYFSKSFEKVLENYDITFHPYDARSRQMFEYLLERGDKIKYVAVCAGQDEVNREVAEDLTAFFRRLERNVPVYQCSRQGIRLPGVDGSAGALHKLYQPELLSMGQLDQMAMVLNKYYNAGSTQDELSLWMACDYFSRMSSRASADFVGAMLRAAGKTAQQAMAPGGWDLPEPMLKNLSITEHLRWCAFHYCMGFSPMSQEEFDQRAQEYLRCKQQGVKPIRISKNMAGRTHACLVDWNDLPKLDERERSITGVDPNYQDSDTQNVLLVPELLRRSLGIQP